MPDPSFVVTPPGNLVGWWLSLYPTAGEAGGCDVHPRKTPRQYVPGQPAADPERARAEAGRRARTRLRRYCAANGLNRLGTLTYAGAGNFEPVAVREHLGQLFRELRTGLGGNRLPYVWVPEWHKTHGLHAHFAVGRFVPRKLIAEAWGRGFVHIKLLSDLPVGSGRLEEARKAAGYLSKYVTKAFDHPTVPGLHRFDVAQGFQPEKVRIYPGNSSTAAVRQASELMGRAPTVSWDCSQATDWQGPPAVWLPWAS